MSSSTGLNNRLRELILYKKPIADIADALTTIEQSSVVEQTQFKASILQYIIYSSYDKNNIFYYTSIIKLFVDMGADVNSRCYKTGNTPLHLIYFYKRYNVEMHQEIIEYLLMRGADINAKNDNGNTPLHFVIVFSKDINMVHHLIQRGANPNIENYNNMTAFDYALMFGCKNLIEYFNVYKREPFIMMLYKTGLLCVSGEGNKQITFCEIPRVVKEVLQNMDLVKEISYFI